ncbi:sterol desaturase family protein [Aurantibacter sp.]|uniref:sterol desaturase family protein n=1 Tax=Aurantibacter sp. TaxID=2807103 RepID=UPI0035C83909
MGNLIEIIQNSYSGYWNYLKNQILLNSNWDNFFYGLILISVVVFILELVFPWRKNQPVFRKDFWLDTFYMFFNFFLLNLIILIALSNATATLFDTFLNQFGIELKSFQIIDISKFPKLLSLLAFFIVSDFVQWLTHNVLHRVPFLWNFHKVHHSVKQMGFAAHLRYHWMEPIVYKSFLYIPLAIIGGFTAKDVAIVHFFAITIGHLNHANLGWDYGVFKYVFNNPKMHIWHHAKELPKHLPKGMNFGITLSLWDYIFKTNYVPYNGKDIELGFPKDDQFPQDFIGQELYPFNKK